MRQRGMDIMDTKDISVWGWIAIQCHRLGWYSSANIAEFLETADKELWGNRHREAWKGKKHYYDMILLTTPKPANFLVAVARCRDLKVGCFVSGYDCEQCKVAAKQGQCNQRGTISHFWQYVLIQDSQEEIDEDVQEVLKEKLVRIWAE